VITVHTRNELGRHLERARAGGRRIGLVPTMGFLHEGHLSLIDVARQRTDFGVLSVFVNPLQFGPDEDLEKYPRDVERDAELARASGIDLLFVPATAEVYRSGEPRVFVDAPVLAGRLCGAFRPGHFRGVLTVVGKLFNIIRPDIAVFGRKDFQQFVLVRRMAADLDLPVEVIGAPIVREADGLAMSSRNVYLDAAARSQAGLLSRALTDAGQAFREGTREAATLDRIIRARLAEGDRVTPQYVEIVSPDTLDPVDTAAPGDVAALAAFVGRTRLIDNLELAET
jgi:pantoate--beta-alanine ligase